MRNKEFHLNLRVHYNLRNKYICINAHPYCDSLYSFSRMSLKRNQAESVQAADNYYNFLRVLLTIMIEQKRSRHCF